MTSANDKLRITLEQLARMHRALAALNAEKARYSPHWFAVLAEGPLDEIQRLERELDALTGRASLRAAQGDLVVRIQGAEMAWPSSPIGVLTSVADAIRKGVQTVAELVLTGDLSSRPTKELNDACDLRLVSVSAGSLVLGLELPQPNQGVIIDHNNAHWAARLGLDLIVTGARWAAGDASDNALVPEIPEAEQRRAVLTQLKRLVPRPRGKIHSIELSGAVTRHIPIHLSRAATKRLDLAIDAIASTAVETYEGELREIDLDKRTLVLREISDGPYEVHCEYVPELDPTALDALDKRVAVTGTRSIDAGRRRPPLKIHRLTVIEQDAADETG